MKVKVLNLNNEIVVVQYHVCSSVVIICTLNEVEWLTIYNMNSIDERLYLLLSYGRSGQPIKGWGLRSCELLQIEAFSSDGLCVSIYVDMCEWMDLRVNVTKR